MTTTIYLGPSAGPGHVSAPDVELRPPIQDGDLQALIASGRAAHRVLIVDGIFGVGQAITLTEIRMAVRLGFELYGSTSMGALRAVEAAPLGMWGLGGIHAEYADGRRTRDSDVALLHDDTGSALTVPLVNVQDLARVLQRGGLDLDRGRDLVAAGAAVHYTERYPEVLRAIAGRIVGARSDFDLDRLFTVDQSWWDRKARDARESVASCLSVQTAAGTAAIHRGNPAPRWRPAPPSFAALLGQAPV